MLCRLHKQAVISDQQPKSTTDADVHMHQVAKQICVQICVSLVCTISPGEDLNRVLN